MSGLVLLCLPIVVSCVVSLAFRGMGKSFCNPVGVGGILMSIRTGGVYFEGWNVYQIFVSY